MNHDETFEERVTMEVSLLKRIVISGMIIMACHSAYGQDGTPLSATGAGEFTTFASSWSSGMGNSGIALVRNGFLSEINPATWAGLENVQFTALYDFSGVNSKDNLNNLSSYYANGTFGGGIFALPLDKDLGLAVAGGFNPLTSYNFTINSPVDSTASVPSYVYKSSGSGGLGEGFVGLSLTPFHLVSVGGMFQYAFGRIQNTRTISFNNSSYIGTYSDYSAYLQGSGGTFGLVFDSLDQFIRADFLKGVSLGGYYKFSYSLHGTFVLDNLYQDTLFSPYSQSGFGYIPPSYGIGVSKAFSDHLTGVLDIRYQQYSKYHDTYTPVDSLRDALFVGGGVEFREGKEYGSLYDRRILRAGFYYQKTQFAVPTKSGQIKQLDELFLTGGIELPMSFSSSVSLSAQYGLRGISSDFLLREQIFRLYFSITMGEGWFSRPEED